MLGLPKSTEFNKRIPKEKFYENLDISPALRKCFVEQIKAIYWANKIATTTTNHAPGSTVSEIEVFEIKLKTRELNEGVLRQIDKEIPYHIVFVLEYEGEYQIWAAYKEVSSGNSAFKVNQYYHTDWLIEPQLPLKVDGLSLDKVYENFVRQIAGEVLQAKRQESLKESVERDIRRLELQKKIDELQVKVRKEKQLNKQVQLNTDLKKLKRELEELVQKERADL